MQSDPSSRGKIFNQIRDIIKQKDREARIQQQKNQIQQGCISLQNLLERIKVNIIDDIQERIQSGTDFRQLYCEQQDLIRFLPYP